MKYENNWESLMKRPVPEWFADAKFGIFIHWGLYSVPAFAPKGMYSEWYGYQILNSPDAKDYCPPFVEYHKKHYGEKAVYADFVKDFTCENFNADEWAELFSKAGAKYINLVSKHHDGYCMYKSDYQWNWNSMDVGPKRDFCRELKDALDKTDVKFGVYHSVYEWWHPLYLKNPEEYAVKHLIPMLKELIEKYKPYTLFTDGEWAYPDTVWHSTDFLQWLYNESSVKDVIVPNDRWGSNTRGRFGGNFTTEYGEIGAGDGEGKIDLEDERPVEECRGIGASFGWNKFEAPEDYMTPDALVKLLVDLVSKGSNLLLNIGPTADGRIPVIMQERLLQMGKWLEVNGEAIYSTRKYKVKTDGDIRYTKKGDIVYAFLMKYPFGRIILEDIDYTEGVRVSLLGCDEEIKTENENGKLCINAGFINPENINSQYVYTFKIER